MMMRMMLMMMMMIDNEDVAKHGFIDKEEEDNN